MAIVNTTGNMKRPVSRYRFIRRAILILSLFLFLATGFPSINLSAQAASAPGVSAKSAILVEATSGAVLFEKNADEQMLIASTTKMLTALVVLDRCDSRELVIIPNDFPTVEGSSMYLKPGETLTVLDLLYGLMIASGNDAAVVLAIHVSGSVEAFSELMNECAASLGCRQSNFVNPHGLDAPDHYSTARDLALIACDAMDNKAFSDIVSTKTITVAGRSFKNHNKLLWTSPGTLGIKTGYTASAGRSLVSCTQRNGMQLICVTLSAPNDWDDHTSLCGWAADAFQFVSILRSAEEYGNVPVISGVKSTVDIRPENDTAFIYSAQDNIEIKWTRPKFVYAPIVKDAQAGEITIYKDGSAEKTVPLLYKNSVALDESILLSPMDRLKRMLFGAEIN